MSSALASAGPPPATTFFALVVAAFSFLPFFDQIFQVQLVIQSNFPDIIIHSTNDELIPNHGVFDITLWVALK